jgi:mono/diheme cytochrome c family protein
MSSLTLRKQFLVSVLLLLAGLILAGCSTTNFLPETAVNNSTERTQQINSGQTAVSDSWDAAGFYASTCASCHGPTGDGTAIAPALNGENIQTAETAWLIETISYGRSGTAMPAWSVESGGSLNSDQIADMAAFLQAGDWEKAGDLAAEQPFSPMGPGMGGGMMGRGRGGMMGNGNGMGNGR